MTKIEINDQFTKKEMDAIMLERRPEFTMIDENTGMIDNYAIVKFDERDPEDLESEKENAADLCIRYTNEEIMQALILMTYEKGDYFDRLPKYIDEFNRSPKSGEPMSFYPDATNEKWQDINIDEHMKDYGDDYFYSAIGTICLNRLY